ncbi:MAG: biopolymer transporter ExbD [Chthoniobacterales bacterium]|nr:biopolymer transporter ExbD [Chthoniobacterales bacterium]
MRFYTRKKRSPQLIIVSLIDILAILLIFFIVTTTFRRDQPRLQINLPESQSAEMVAVDKLEPLILRVKSAKEITLGPEAVTLEELSAALKSARQDHPERQIAMQADREAPFGVVVKVLDALKLAGMRNVSTFTQPEAK